MAEKMSDEKPSYSIGLIDDEHIIKLIHEIIDPWCDKIDAELENFKTQHDKKAKRMAKQSNAVFRYQQEHAKQLNGYLEGFNKILKEKL